MTPTQSRRELRFMTGFLVLASLAVFVSIAVGSQLGPQEPELIAAGPTTTRPAEATTQPPPPSTTSTTTTPSTTTTLPLLTPRLVVQTEQDIAAAIAPKVAFITTLNGSGSGVLVDDDLVITNAHVVWPFRDVGVLFPGDNRRGGTVIGVNSRADLALIKLNSPRLPEPVEFGETRTLEEGDRVFVVGYPGVDNFTPEPTVVPASYQTTVDWAFSGVEWTVSGAAAVGGQSGGALLDEYGRLIGITTFGSQVELYSVTMEDLEDIIDDLRDGAEETVDERLPPRRGGRLEFEVSLDGPWEQAAFVTWLSPGVETTLESTSGVTWRALDVFGFELATGNGELDVFWPAATPGVVLAESTVELNAAVEMNRPLIRIDDADDGQTIVLQDEPLIVGGFVDVAGDRDWFLVNVEEDLDTLRIAVQAQTRVRISLYDRETSAIIASVDHERGFLFTDPILETGALSAGDYVIAVEDIAFQFGTYSLEVSS